MFARKYRIHFSLALLALAIIFAPSYLRKPDEQKSEAAQKASKMFLELVDSGQYEPSWTLSSAYLRKEIPLEQWQQQLSDVRTAAGALLSRELKDQRYNKETRKGVPEGEYMVFIYNTAFQNKSAATETITLMLEDDQFWRVAGYFID